MTISLKRIVHSSAPTITIIGGGLAGSAAGAILARAGLPVAIIERDSFPRDKLCGEFLSGESRRLLEKIGCLSDLMRHDPPAITQVRFISPSGNCVTLPLAEPALGISRRLLDETLFRHACGLGADGWINCEVRDISIREEDGRRTVQMVQTLPGQQPVIKTLHPSLIIGAYGRRTKLDRDLHRPFLKNLASSVGLKLHHTIAPGLAGTTAMSALQSTTEIYALNGGYCGLAMVEGGQINACMLLTQTAFKRIGSARWPEIATFLSLENPKLGERLSGLVPVDEPVLTVSQMPFGKKEKAIDNILFIGDAAGMITPLCGDGQAMALESGVMVAELIIRKLFSPGSSDHFSPQALTSAELSASWQRQWSGCFSARIKTGRLLQGMLLLPPVANATIAILQHAPDKVKNYLVRATRGH